VLQLVIENAAPVGVITALAGATLTVAHAVRVVLPMLSDKAARRVALVERARAKRK
jgi:hypothetical protein